ncbi:MAG: hypothetical protein DRP02_13870 [Candidatus Gerdarchaeota archaeon]|nr:MAG: hypothetical protein DRP02_13870 [Candidatus Gerdarchaeota archaeon]
MNNATWVHPGQEISFKHSFYSYEYEKGQYLAKLRVELVAFINDEPTTLYDSIDFLIEVRGSATPGEIAAIIIPTVLIALFILLTYLLQRFLNKRLYETITFANAWLFLPIYLQRKKSQSNRTMIPYDPNFAADFAATCQGLLLPEKFKNRYFPPLKEENNNEA